MTTWSDQHSREPTVRPTLRAARRVVPAEPLVPSDTMEAGTRVGMISEAAYFLAERRGFEPGHELEDWLAAETLVDLALAAGKVMAARREIDYTDS